MGKFTLSVNLPEPGISLEFPCDNKNLMFEIEFRNGQFLIYILCEMVKPYFLIKEVLHEALGFKEDGFRRYKWSKPDLIETSVCELSEKLAVIDILS